MNGSLFSGAISIATGHKRTRASERVREGCTTRPRFSYVTYIFHPTISRERDKYPYLYTSCVLWRRSGHPGPDRTADFRLNSRRTHTLPLALRRRILYSFILAPSIATVGGAARVYLPNRTSVALREILGNIKPGWMDRDRSTYAQRVLSAREFSLDLPDRLFCRKLFRIRCRRNMNPGCRISETTFDCV